MSNRMDYLTVSQTAEISNRMTAAIVTLTVGYGSSMAFADSLVSLLIKVVAFLTGLCILYSAYLRALKAKKEFKTQTPKDIENET